MNNTNTSTVVSAEILEDGEAAQFIKFESANLNIDINKATHSTNGMFIPIKHQYSGITTTFKIQTPEIIGYVRDCDLVNNPGKQYKASLVVDSNNKDKNFSLKDVELQEQTVKILNSFKDECIKQLNSKKEKFIEKSNEKNKKKINDLTWKCMLDDFEVVRPYERLEDSGDKKITYYLNPKISNSDYFRTTFKYGYDLFSFESFIKKFLDKKIYCVALIAIESLFYQPASNKIFAQAKLLDLVVTRVPVSISEQILLPSRFKLDTLKPINSESDGGEAVEINVEEETKSLDE